MTAALNVRTAPFPDLLTSEASSDGEKTLVSLFTNFAKKFLERFFARRPARRVAELAATLECRPIGLAWCCLVDRDCLCLIIFQ